MNISEMSVRRPVLMTMVYVVLIVIAALFIPRLDQAMFPDMDMPFLMVYADCGDADPESIELQVAKTLEQTVASVENLNKITSMSRQGACYVILEFNYGTDLDTAKNDVSSLLTMVAKYLPDWVDDVQTLKLNTLMSSGSVMTLSVSGPYSIAQLKDITNSSIEPLLSRIEGVGSVNVYGGGDIEFHVLVDPNRLEAYGLSSSQIVSALATSNTVSSGGEITDNFIDYTVRTDNRFRSIKDMEEVLVSTKNGVPIKVKDLGVVIQTTEERARESFIEGDPIVTIRVNKNADASVIQVAKKIKAALPGIQNSLPNDIQIDIRRDSSKNISEVLGEVYNSAIFGVILAAIIIFLFLRGIRPTLIISLSMPICILFTVMCMSIFDISVNMVSMSGLILGIGMIVDASIIILENSIRFRQSGESAPASAILGSKNMFAAIFASTLTTICVFLPEIIYMNQLKMVGQMLKDLIFTVCISLLSSLFVAITLVPALFSIMRVSTTTQRQHKGLYKKFDDFCTAIQTKLENGYERSLAFFIDHKTFFIAPLLVLFIFCISLLPHLGFQMMPSNPNGDELTLSLTLPNGTAQEVTRDKLFAMQDKVMSLFPEGSYENIMIQVDGNEGSLSIALPTLKDQKYSAIELREMIRPELSMDPEATWTYSSGQKMSSSYAVDIEISSDNMDSAFKTAKDVENILKSHPNLTNVTNSLVSGQPQIEVVLDKDRAANLGVSASTVGAVLTTSILGQKSTQVSTMSSTESYFVRVKLNKEYISKKSQIGSLLVPTNVGMVRLDSIASIEETTAPTEIQRENKKRINHVTADTIEGVSASVALNEVKSLFAEQLTIPDDVTLSYGGDQQEMAELAFPVIMCAVMALILVYVVMAAQFESLLNPFIVFCTIPLLLIGVILIHILSGMSLSMMSFIGVIALVGVVVNNGIVLVDAISREIRETRIPVRTACLTSARNRLRPILMTTLTTVLGMIPMAFFPGEGAKMMQPIAMTFVGGVITGAFLTLYLSPVLYSFFNKRKEKNYDNPNTLENQLRAFDMEQSRRILKDM